jgi:molybdopterin biosynthesis enzyme
VILEEFIRPAIYKMQGKGELRRTQVVARLDRDIKGGGGMTHYIRAEVRITDDGFLAIPSGTRTTPSVMPLSLANGFIIVPQDVNYICAGESVKVQIIHEPFRPSGQVNLPTSQNDSVPRSWGPESN